MKNKPNSRDCAKALAWYKEHHDHVNKLVGLTTDEFCPSGSDCFQPELWKPGHWKWLLIRNITAFGGIELTEREKLLIEYGLYVLECQCYGEELDPSIESELGGTPKPDEVRQVMNKFKDR